MFFSISKNKYTDQSSSPNNGHKGIVVNTGLAEKEKALYEQIIQQQKEEITFLRNLLNNK